VALRFRVDFFFVTVRSREGRLGFCVAGAGAAAFPGLELGVDGLFPPRPKVWNIERDMLSRKSEMCSFLCVGQRK